MGTDCQRPQILNGRPRPKVGAHDRTSARAHDERCVVGVEAELGNGPQDPGVVRNPDQPASPEDEPERRPLVRRAGRRETNPPGLRTLQSSRHRSPRSLPPPSRGLRAEGGDTGGEVLGHSPAEGNDDVAVRPIKGGEEFRHFSLYRFRLGRLEIKNR